MNRVAILLLGLLTATLLPPVSAGAADLANSAAVPAIIPRPKSLKLGTGRMELTAATRIVAGDAKLLPLALILSNFDLPGEDRSRRPAQSGRHRLP